METNDTPVRRMGADTQARPGCNRQQLSIAPRASVRQRRPELKPPGYEPRPVNRASESWLSASVVHSAAGLPPRGAGAEPRPNSRMHPVRGVYWPSVVDLTIVVTAVSVHAG